MICQFILRMTTAFPNAIQLGGDRESLVNKPSSGAMLILMASQGLLAALWCVDSCTGHVVCSLSARRSMWMACFDRVVCLVFSWYLCMRRELATKLGLQGDSHEEDSPSFLLINYGTAPKSEEDDGA